MTEAFFNAFKFCGATTGHLREQCIFINHYLADMYDRREENKRERERESWKNYLINSVRQLIASIRYCF